MDEAVLLGRAEQRAKETAAKGGTPRPDDTPETVKNRLDVYRKNTAPLIAYYTSQKKVVTVNGMAPIADVTRAIDAAIAKGR